MEEIAHASGFETISIDVIRESNAKCHIFDGLVAVFVGGTDGIGKNTAKELFLRTKRPKAYIIGRNEEKGNATCDELHEINPQGKAIFIKKDVSLIRNVDEFCAEIRKLETRINCLFLTAGFMSLSGREETPEGLDKKMVVNYYARMRCIFNLLPCLDAAVAADQLARVVTVLAAGSEQDILHTDDLDLKHHWNLNECMAHCVIMSDFMVEELARRHPSIAFSHSFPGSVKSGIANSLTAGARLAAKVLYATMNSWLLNVHESGERHLFQITSQCYPSAARQVGVPVPPGLSVMPGTDGKPGSGAYLLDWDCKPTGEKATLSKYREMGLGPKVWDHTKQILDEAVQKSKKEAKRPAAGEAEGSGSRPVPNPTGWRPAGGFTPVNGPNPTGWRAA